MAVRPVLIETGSSGRQCGRNGKLISMFMVGRREVFVFADFSDCFVGFARISKCFALRERIPCVGSSCGKVFLFFVGRWNRDFVWIVEKILLISAHWAQLCSLSEQALTSRSSYMISGKAISSELLEDLKLLPFIQILEFRRDEQGEQPCWTHQTVPAWTFSQNDSITATVDHDDHIAYSALRC